MSSDCQVFDDPADAFIEIFDKVPEDFFLGDEADSVRDLDAVLSEAAAVERDVLRDGKASSRLTDLPDDDTRYRVALARLIGLDRVLRHANPHSGAPSPPSLTFIAARYARCGRFNTDPQDGLLLPRLMNYGAPRHRADKYEFFGVLRVEPHRKACIDFIALGARGWPTRNAKDALIVACVPFLDKIEDIILERVEKFGDARYRLGPSDNRRLEQRVDDAIMALDTSGATIGLLPEGALSATLLALWQRRLAETFSAGGSRVALIVVGTGPVTGENPPRNRGVVLDRQGTVLWEQDKLCDYTLVKRTIEDWRLPNLGDGDLLEDITRGSHLVVAETTLGRLAILICEDLQRCDTRQVVPRDLGISHIFVPVFDAPLGPSRWERFASERHLNWTGTRVVVSNSRVVGNLQPTPPTAMLTALGMSPKRKAGTWDYDATELKATDSATDVACVRLWALGPPP